METPVEESTRNLHEAWNWIERARYAQAEIAIARGLALEPANEDLLYARAYCAYVQDHNEDARQQLMALLNLAPDHFQAEHLLATIAVEERQYPQAEQMLLKLLRDAPDNSDLLADYAMLMLRTLNIDKAEQLALRALRDEPENQRALLVATMCDIVHGRADSSHGQLARLLRNFPHARSSSMILIHVLSDANRLDEAQRVAEALVRADPGTPGNVQLVKELRYARHWSLWPLIPFQRFGWGAMVGLWAVMAFGLRGLRGHVPDPLLVSISMGYLALCVYSWVWPPILRRILLGKQRT